MTNQPAEDYSLDARFEDPVWDSGWTGVPNVFLNYYQCLGVEDAVAMLLIQIMKHKWTARDSYPKLANIPMSCSVRTCREYIRDLRRRGLLFTHRRYYTPKTAPSPDLVGKLEALEFNLRALMYNILRVQGWIEEGHPPAAFAIELPFSVVYRVGTGYFQDVPDSIYDQCVQRGLGVSDDAVEVLKSLRQLGDRTETEMVEQEAVLRVVGLRKPRALVAIEHLVEAQLVVCGECGDMRLLNKGESADRAPLLLQLPPLRKSRRRKRGRRRPVDASDGKTASRATVRKTASSSTIGKAPSSKATGSKAPSSFTDRLKEDPDLNEDELSEEKSSDQQQQGADVVAVPSSGLRDVKLAADQVIVPIYDSDGESGEADSPEIPLTYLIVPIPEVVKTDVQAREAVGGLRGEQRREVFYSVEHALGEGPESWTPAEEARIEMRTRLERELGERLARLGGFSLAEALQQYFSPELTTRFLDGASNEELARIEGWVAIAHRSREKLDNPGGFLRSMIESREHPPRA